MSIRIAQTVPPLAFSPWPEALARQYREAGYWQGRPLGDILARQALTRPDALALICGERRYSYQALAARVECLAAALARRGLQRHQTALVQLPNVAEFYMVYFALLRIGVVPVNALFSHQRHELSAYARQVGPAVLIADTRHALFANDSFIRELQTQHPTLGTVLLRGHADPALSLEQAVAGLAGGEEGAAPGLAEEARPTDPGQVAFFQLSGGSTGTPKLIPRTHDDYYYSVRRSAELCGLSPETRYLCALPAAHNYPLSSPGALGVLDAGGCVVLAPSPEASACFDLIERHQITMTALVPSAVALWLQAAPGQRQRLASLRLLQVGGASFAEALARRVPLELGCQLQQVFGMAEGLVNYTRLDDSPERIFTTQGCPMSPADEVRVLDAQGHPVPPGQTGMLATRGPYTFRGYYRSPEHNRQAFDGEGFYHSGDLVQQGADGYLRVVGRVKDQINRGGEKISAEEVEVLLLRHPEVTHAGLVAMPDPLLGEKSCAYLVGPNPGLGALALRKFLRGEGLADYKIPDRFEWVPKMPLTAVGKIDKNTLRSWAQALGAAQPAPLA
ncbi:MAG: (2,3-dihydroxybenzoyl)adenylate synthase [Zoogloea sp.]|uniref:(2,3-dihydroxybenzoyl)adenylate synthase n=1 Tax=Zoogloea sp. TaxID=49181 RepID=UPI003F2FFDD5